MAELQEKSTSSWSDVTFLEAASEALLEVRGVCMHVCAALFVCAACDFSLCELMQCRRVLKYSYAFGYYMKDGREKRLFEHLQVCVPVGDGVIVVIVVICC